MVCEEFSIIDIFAESMKLYELTPIFKVHSNIRLKCTSKPFRVFVLVNLSADFFLKDYCILLFCLHAQLTSSF